MLPSTLLTLHSPNHQFLHVNTPLPLHPPPPISLCFLYTLLASSTLSSPSFPLARPHSSAPFAMIPMADRGSLREMSKSRALDLAFGFGGKINKKEAFSAVE